MAKGNRNPSASEMTHNLKVYGDGSMANGLRKLERVSRKSGYDQGVRDTYGMSVLEFVSHKYGRK